MANGTSGTRGSSAASGAVAKTGETPEATKAIVPVSPLKQNLANKYSAYDTSADYSDANNIPDSLLDELLDDGYGQTDIRTYLNNMSFKSGRVELLDIATGEKVTLKKETVAKAGKNGYQNLGNKFTIVSGAMTGVNGDGFEVFSEKDWPKAIFKGSVFGKKK